MIDLWTQWNTAAASWITDNNVSRHKSKEDTPENASNVKLTETSEGITEVLDAKRAGPNSEIDLLLIEDEKRHDLALDIQGCKMEEENYTLPKNSKY